MADRTSPLTSAFTGRSLDSFVLIKAPANNNMFFDCHIPTSLRRPSWSVEFRVPRVGIPWSCV